MPGYAWSYATGAAGIVLWALTKYKWKSAAVIGVGGLALGVVLQLETMR